MIEVAFENVTITVRGTSPKEAYKKLCDVLQAAGFEWTSDGFAVFNSEQPLVYRYGDTTELIGEVIDEPMA